MDETILVVVAGQRSGSTLFNKTLEKYGNVKSYGEIFHDAAGIGDNGRFFASKLDSIKNDNKLIIPTPSNQEIIWDEYLNKIVEKKPSGTIPLLDIKYNSWHHLDPVWKNQFSQPALLRKMIVDPKYKIIHISRKDFFNQACSQVRALHTGKYHSFHGGKSLSEEVYVNPSEIVHYAKFFKENYLRFDSWLNDLMDDRYKRFYYEDFSTPLGFNEAATELVSYGVRVSLFEEFSMQKVGTPPNDWIKNYDEVIDIYNSEFK